MAPLPSTPAKAKSRALRVVNRILFWSSVLLIVIFAAWRIRLYFRVKTQIAAIQQAGLPLLPADINEMLPAVPGEKNGALILMQAFTKLQMIEGSRSNRVDDLLHIGRSGSWSEAEKALAISYVRTNREALDLAHTALSRESFVFPADYSYGFDTLLPHMAKVKEIAQIHRIEAMLEAGDRQLDWTNSVLEQLKLAESLNAEPTLIGFFVRGAIVRSAMRSAEYALNRTALDRQSCEALQRAFARAVETNLLPRALITERAMTIPYFRFSWSEMQRFDDSSDGVKTGTRTPMKPSGKPFALLFFTGFLERDLSFYLGAMDHAIDLSRLPTPEVLSRNHAVGS